MHQRTIVIAKETSHYRIVSDDSNRWRVVANRPIAQGESVKIAGTGFRLEIRNEASVEVALEPTGERSLVDTATSAVPGDASCEPTTLDIPWCFMRHSCEPNTADQWIADTPATSAYLRTTTAARDIAEGEELTCDYALEQYTHGAIACRCGAASCRREIRGFSGLNHATQERLLPQASPWVQQRHGRESGRDQPGNATRRTGLDEDGQWFLEGTVPGRRHGNVNHGFRITDFVHKGRTPFQECLIFDNPVYGRVLVLDGIVQLSTSDEFIYHEMLVHPPLFAHRRPRRVVIVGGGDGGTLREVLRHDPEQVVMIDIDEQFVRTAAEHLPTLSAGAFEDPRVTLLFEDASQALRRYEDTFDVAIIDCNDAIGTSEALFEADFYATVARALNDQGLCAVQAGSMLDVDFLQQTRQRITSQLGRTTGFRLTMPSYHCGEYVFLVASAQGDPAGPDGATLAELQQQRAIITKYWSPAIHHASQVLPAGSSLW